MLASGTTAAVAGTVAIAISLAACGNDDDQDNAEAVASTPNAAALLDYVPASPSGVRLTDLATAREELGLPPDADVSEPGASLAESRIAAAAGAVIPYLSLPRPRPIEAAIDHGAITAAASNLVVGDPGIAAIATPQSLDDVAQGLVADGYERRGDLLESDSAFVEGSYNVIADAGDGVMVLGYESGTVERAIDHTPGKDNPARTLIEEVHGITRGAVAPAHLDCIDAIAAGESADRERGEMLIEVRGEVAAQRFRLPDALTLSEFEFGKPDVDGRGLIAPVEVDPQSEPLTSPVGLLTAKLAPSEIYAC